MMPGQYQSVEAQKPAQSYLWVKIVIGILAGLYSVWALLNVCWTIDLVRYGSWLSDSQNPHRGTFNLIFDEVWYAKGFTSRFWPIGQPKELDELGAIYIISGLVNAVRLGFATVVAISGLTILCKEKIKGNLHTVRLFSIFVVVVELWQFINIAADLNDHYQNHWRLRQAKPSEDNVGAWFWILILCIIPAGIAMSVIGFVVDTSAETEDEGYVVAAPYGGYYGYQPVVTPAVNYAQYGAVAAPPAAVPCYGGQQQAPMMAPYQAQGAAPVV